MFTEGKIKKGEQMFSNYGRCSNRIWIMLYGYGLLDNEYDGFTIHIDLIPNQKAVILRKGKTQEYLFMFAKEQLLQ